MKSYKFFFGTIVFIATIAFNISVHSVNSYKDVSILEIEMLNVAAEPEGYIGQYDVGCMPCPQPGTVLYFCIQGTTTCFGSGDCQGGIC